MAWFDPAAWFLGDNPVYRRGLRPIPRNDRPPLRSIVTFLVSMPALLGVLLLFGLPWILGLLYLALAWLAPAVAASILASERERGTLTMLLLTPYSRKRILLGLLAARLRWWTVACFWSLPFLMLSGFLEVARNQPHDSWGAPASGRTLLIGTLWGATPWLGLVGAYLFAVSVGALAAVTFRSALSAIASTYGILLLVHLMCICLNGWPILIFFVAFPYVFLNDAVTHLERSDLDE